MYRSSAILCLLLLCAGCAKQEQASTPVSEKSAISVPLSAVVPSLAAPGTLSEVTPHPAEQTVSEFMTAMLRGDDEKIRTFLTPAARKAGEEEDFPFSCSASDTATFIIDNTVDRGDSTTLVSTTWTDIDIDGQKESKIVWTLVQTDEGWRVSGALVALFEDQPPIQINFEDPQSVHKILAEAETREKQRLANPPSVEINR